MLVTVASAGTPCRLAVTSVQWPPRSAVYQTFPSFVPAQTRRCLICDGAMANTTSGANWPRLSAMMPPDDFMYLGSPCDRSGLATCQLWPLFVVLKTTWQP